MVISDQVLGAAEPPIRQSLTGFLLGVDKCPKLGCPSLEVPTSLRTAQAASGKGRVVASLPMSCSLSLASTHELTGAYGAPGRFDAALPSRQAVK